MLAPSGVAFRGIVSSVNGLHEILTAALLLFSLAISQAGLLPHYQCLCPVSGKHRAACCCKAESKASGCCKKPDEKREERPATATRPSETMGGCCHCFEATDEPPEPSPAERPSGNLLEIVPTPVWREIILPLPPPPPVRAVPLREDLRPPPSPQRIQYC